MSYYHYTSYANWKDIQLRGLYSEEIVNDELSTYFPTGVRGVWLWENDPKEKHHLWNLIYQLSSKNRTRIVKLKISGISRDDLLSFEGRTIELPHMGCVGTFYGSVGELAYIYPGWIRPEKISLVGDYDLIKLLE